MHTYLALLRGVNVGGNAKIKMTDLQTVLTGAGLENVKTYIQSGNVLFSSSESNTGHLEKLIHDAIQRSFALDVGIVVFSKEVWATIIKAAPEWWGNTPEWKHNLIVLLKPYNMRETIEAIGALKPDIEKMTPGDGVLYQSMSIKLFGSTTTGKLAASPIYKRMTIRNFNTTTKLQALLNQR